jgi:hypothetical protein
LLSISGYSKREYLQSKNYGKVGSDGLGTLGFLLFRGLGGFLLFRFGFGLSLGLCWLLLSFFWGRLSLLPCLISLRVALLLTLVGVRGLRRRSDAL